MWPPQRRRSVCPDVDASCNTTCSLLGVPCMCSHGIFSLGRAGVPMRGLWKRGSRQFSKGALKNYKKEMHVTLVCRDCIGKRHDIRQKLLRPESWRCTCPGTTATRVHFAGNEKCELYPKYAGEKRWPGKNVNVCLLKIFTYTRGAANVGKWKSEGT